MELKRTVLQDDEKVNLAPVTTADCVYGSDGTAIDELMVEQEFDKVIQGVPSKVNADFLGNKYTAEDIDKAVFAKDVVELDTPTQIRDADTLGGQYSSGDITDLFRNLIKMVQVSGSDVTLSANGNGTSSATPSVEGYTLIGIIGYSVSSSAIRMIEIYTSDGQCRAYINNTSTNQITARVNFRALFVKNM